MREGSPLKNQTCEQGDASSIWPRRSRRTLERVTSTPHLSQITPRCFMRLYLPHRHSKSVIEVPRSNGLERYKVCPPTAFTPPWRLPVLFGYAFCLSSRPEAHRNW